MSKRKFIYAIKEYRGYICR